MSHDLNNLLLFVGRFHPLVVHLPIGGLVLLGLLEVVARFTRWKDAAQSGRWILVFVSVSAVFSAGCGWMLSQADGYDPELLKWHRAAGLGVAGGCVLTLLLRQRKGSGAYRISLGLTLVLVVAAGHLGGSITHGSDFLTRYAPISLRALVGHSRPPQTGLAIEQPVFAGVIEPILRQRCTACHGPERHKADLRLDTFAGLLKGGQDGPVIRPGLARDSALIQCIISSLDADGHMPPEDQPQVSAEEIALLEWWINDGANATQTVGDLEHKPGLEHLLEIVAKPTEPSKP